MKIIGMIVSGLVGAGLGAFAMRTYDVGGSPSDGLASLMPSRSPAPAGALEASQSEEAYNRNFFLPIMSFICHVWSGLTEDQKLSLVRSAMFPTVPLEQTTDQQWQLVREHIAGHEYSCQVLAQSGV